MRFHRLTFISGCVVGAAVVLEGGLPRSWQAAVGAAVLIIGMGAFFTLIYGLVSLLPVRVEIRERNIVRAHGESSAAWKYSELVGYRVSTEIWGVNHVRTLVLHTTRSRAVHLEIDPNVSDEQIDLLLRERIHSGQRAA
ncbi:MAG: hypothetical protein ACRD88_21155 [Terriglobia bacterium]